MCIDNIIINILIINFKSIITINVIVGSEKIEKHF